MHTISQHSNFLYCTDLEPDDIISVMIFVLHISEQAQHSSTPINLAFLVGEGDSRIKLARIQKIIDNYRRLGLLQEVNISYIQGYSNFRGLQRNFKADGKDTLNLAEIATASASLPDGTLENTKKSARDSIKLFLEQHSKTLVISIKPMCELQDIANEDPSIFSQHILTCVGSYNFRSICEGPEQVELQTNLIRMLNSFSACFIYETYSTTETNSTSSANATEFFNLIARADEQTILGTMRKCIQDWNNFILEADRAKLPSTLSKLNDILTPDEQTQFIREMEQDATDAAWNTLSGIVEPALKTYSSDQNLLPVFQQLHRFLTKWRNITQEPMQFVNADPGLLAILTGHCDEFFSVQPARLDFSGQYLSLQPPEEHDTKSDPVFVYLPGKTTTLKQYLQFRLEEGKEGRSKPPQLVAVQTALLSAINHEIIECGKKIQALSLQKQATGTFFLQFLPYLILFALASIAIVVTVLTWGIASGLVGSLGAAMAAGAFAAASTEAIAIGATTAIAIPEAVVGLVTFGVFYCKNRNIEPERLIPQVIPS